MPPPSKGLCLPFVVDDSKGTDGRRTLAGTAAVASGLTERAGIKPGRFSPGEDCAKRDLLLFGPLPYSVDGMLALEVD